MVLIPYYFIPYYIIPYCSMIGCVLTSETVDAIVSNV